MTYSALTATLSIMRTGNSDILDVNKYSDAALLLLNQEAAKIEMQLDLEQALSIPTDDEDGLLDELADNFSVRLSRALSYKQLALFYQLNDSGEGTKNRHRWEMYAEKYDRERLGFSGLQNTTAETSVRSVPIWR